MEYMVFNAASRKLMDIFLNIVFTIIVCIVLQVTRHVYHERN